MQLKNLIADEDAVSPVIGVILMVAITVILAAVIGTFVLGLGDQVQSSAPNANFQFEYDSTTCVQITHTGGQDVDADNVNVQVGGSDASDCGSGEYSSGSAFSGTINTGTSGAYATGTAEETVRVIWNSPGGGSSQTIGESEVPS
ncbi:type IV pilin [Halorarius halobius]|uniref:type IV pilin n=1 Tax=Halorarius halobius TaxID=2962671 RepID=UPI0020CD48AC|nr:type IV pilin N-terminal domain-containing protein [Halorarius halobius]